jgi:drug/metabolite transporter (DMT)-like permease
MTPTRNNWISIFLLGLIWGGTFMVVSIALEGYGPVTVAAARTGLGAIALTGLMVAMRAPLPSRAALINLIPIGILNTALPFVLLSWGQQYVPSAFAGVSMAMLPLFGLPLAHVFSDERLQGNKALGVFIGFLGALVLVGPGLLDLGQGAEPLGQLACVAATLSYAISSVWTRRCPPVDPITLAAFTLIVGAVILTPAMIVIEGIPSWQGPRTGFAILFLGFFPTALAALLRVLVIRSAGSVFMTLVNYQVPLWSVVFGWLILGEDLPWRFFGALGLILFGLAVSQSRGAIRLFTPRA